MAQEKVFLFPGHMTFPTTVDNTLMQAGPLVIIMALYNASCHVKYLPIPMTNPFSGK